MGLPQVQSTPSLAGIRVVIVEDEFFIAFDLQDMFEDAGALVDVAANLKAGMALLEKKPDCAVLDVRLAEGDIFPLADRLAADGVPIVFHSGHAPKHMLLSRYPEAQIVTKPASEGELIAAVRLALSVSGGAVRPVGQASDEGQHVRG